MDTFASYVNAAYQVMQVHLDICGFDITMWQLFMFTALAGALLSLLFGIFE